MDRNVFDEQMELAAKLFNRLPDPDVMNAYFVSVQHWTDDQFTSAMAWCCQNQDRFPSINQLRLARPKAYKTADDWEHQPFLEVDEPEDQRGPVTLENQIDAMDIHDLVELLLPFWDDSTICDTDERKTAAATFVAKRFQKRPNGWLWRPVIRSLLQDKLNSI
jgi:hypothetical protein